ncbi:MAG: hypothetical protein O3C21_07560 [Verrucomicrobia bacterium]|nr:hypothetical protein [Verrucomicrobiota bacterium]
MKKGILIFATAGLLLSGVSCGPNAQTGAVLGGLGGAAVGGIIGNQSGRGLEGAAVGGALGAGSGALIGNAQDRRNQGYYDQRYYEGPPPRRY